MGSMFFPLKVLTVRIENNFKWNCQSYTMSICQSFELPNFDAANIKCYTVVHSFLYCHSPIHIYTIKKA